MERDGMVLVVNCGIGNGRNTEDPEDVLTSTLR
jgi:hypothetical protein